MRKRERPSDAECSGRQNENGRVEKWQRGGSQLYIRRASQGKGAHTRLPQLTHTGWAPLIGPSYGASVLTTLNPPLSIRILISTFRGCPSIERTRRYLMLNVINIMITPSLIVALTNSRGLSDAFGIGSST